MSSPDPVDLPELARARVPMDAWVERLCDRYGDRITGHLALPAQEGSYAELPEGLSPRVRDALASRGITRLYDHQRATWEAVQAGQHVVIATPTASGKTLCYNLPILEGVLRRQARALYLFPTKALAQDQVAELLALNDGGRLGVRAYTFDGDTPSDARAAVRLAGDVVVSNPDMLHQAILPHHTKWASFFESLRYIVIDEVHTYRGGVWLPRRQRAAPAAADLCVLRRGAHVPPVLGNDWQPEDPRGSADRCAGHGDHDLGGSAGSPARAAVESTRGQRRSRHPGLRPLPGNPAGAQRHPCPLQDPRLRALASPGRGDHQVPQGCF